MKFPLLLTQALLACLVVVGCSGGREASEIAAEKQKLDLARQRLAIEKQALDVERQRQGLQVNQIQGQQSPVQGSNPDQQRQIQIRNLVSQYSGAFARLDSLESELSGNFSSFSANPSEPLIQEGKRIEDDWAIARREVDGLWHQIWSLDPQGQYLVQGTLTRSRQRLLDNNMEADYCQLSLRM